MEAMKHAKIYSAYEKYQAELLLGILQNNEIACYRQGVGAGGYMDIYAGNSLFGEDIYVDEKDAARAAQLIRETVGREYDIEGEEQRKKEPEAGGRFDGKYRIWASILVILLLAAIVFSVCFKMF